MGVGTAAGGGETFRWPCLPVPVAGFFFFFFQLLVCLGVTQPACLSDPLLAFLPGTLSFPLCQPRGRRSPVEDAMPRVADVLPGETVTPMLVIMGGVSGRKLLSLPEGQRRPYGRWPVAAPCFSPLPFFSIFPQGSPILKTEPQPHPRKPTPSSYHHSFLHLCRFGPLPPIPSLVPK